MARYHADGGAGSGETNLTRRRQPWKRVLLVSVSGLACLALSTSPISAEGKPAKVRRPIAAPTAAPTAAAGGKWNVTVSLSVADDTPILTAVLEAESPIRGWLQTSVPSLVVRCQTPRAHDETVLLSAKGLPVQPGLDVYLVTGLAASADRNDGNHMLGVRFDAAPSEQWGVAESTDGGALFIAPFYAAQMVGRLAHSRRLLIEFTPLNAPPAIISFDTRGFKTHAARVLSACPQIDRIKKRYPLGLEPLTAPTEPLIGRYADTLRSGLGAARIGRRSKQATVRARAVRSRHVRRRPASRA